MKKSILFFLVLNIIFQLGCAVQNNVEVRDEDDNIGIADVAAEDNEILSVSEDIADIVVELYGIDDATAILFNEDVLVGIVLAAGQDITDEIKNTIVGTVKERHPQINKVHISLNKKIFNQTEDIIMDLLQGKSYDDYVNEISKMIDKVEKEK